MYKPLQKEIVIHIHSIEQIKVHFVHSSLGAMGWIKQPNKTYVSTP